MRRVDLMQKAGRTKGVANGRTSRHFGISSTAHILTPSGTHTHTHTHMHAHAPPLACWGQLVTWGRGDSWQGRMPITRNGVDPRTGPRGRGQLEDQGEGPRGAPPPCLLRAVPTRGNEQAEAERQGLEAFARFVDSGGRTELVAVET